MFENEVVSMARGRVNLLGEHTDISDGYVLSTLIPQATRVELRKRKDMLVRASSHGYSVAEFELGHEQPVQKWYDCLQAATWILAKEGFLINGVDVAIASSIPTESGLAASSALIISLLRGLNELFQLNLNPMQMALMGQKAENEFIDIKDSVTSSIAVSLGQLGEATIIDTRSLETKNYPLPFDKVEVIVIDSGVHGASASDFNQRRSECEWASRLLDVAQLRDIKAEDIERFKMLPDILIRRVRHVVSENARALAAVETLKRLDFVGFGDLISASHISLRDDFEVSTPEVDLLVELAMEHSEVYGARLTGHGFGGSIVAVTQAGEAEHIALNIIEEYRRVEKSEPQILVPRILYPLPEQKVPREMNF